MSNEVQAVIDSIASDEPEVEKTITPDAPEKGETAEKPEVAEQEVEQETKEDDEVEKLRKKAFALEKRVQRLAADKHRSQGELHAERERREQIEQWIREQQSPSERKELTPDDIRNQAKQIIEQERTTAQLDDFVDTGRRQVKGFDEKVQTVHSEAPLLDPKGNPTPLMNEIRECEQPFKVLAYLADNPDEAAELAGMSPSRIARTLAKIEDGLSKPTKKVSSAPVPIQPLSGGGKGSVNVEDLSPSELLKLIRTKP